MSHAIGIIPQPRESDAESLRQWRKKESYRMELENQMRQKEQEKVREKQQRLAENDIPMSNGVARYSTGVSSENRLESFQSKYQDLQAKQAEIMSQLQQSRMQSVARGNPGLSAASGARSLARQFANELQFSPPPPPPQGRGGWEDRERERARPPPSRETEQPQEGRRNGMPNYWALDRGTNERDEPPPPSRRYDGGMERTVLRPPPSDPQEYHDRGDRMGRENQPPPPPPRRRWDDHEPTHEPFNARRDNTRDRAWENERDIPRERSPPRRPSYDESPSYDRRRDGAREYESDLAYRRQTSHPPPNSHSPPSYNPPHHQHSASVLPGSSNGSIAPAQLSSQPSFARPAHKSWTSSNGVFTTSTQEALKEAERARKQREYAESLRRQVEEKEEQKRREKELQEIAERKEAEELAKAQSEEKKQLGHLIHEVAAVAGGGVIEHHPPSRRQTQSDFPVHHAESDSQANSRANSPRHLDQERERDGYRDISPRRRDERYDGREDMRHPARYEEEDRRRAPHPHDVGDRRRSPPRNDDDRDERDRRNDHREERSNHRDDRHKQRSDSPPRRDERDGRYSNRSDDRHYSNRRGEAEPDHRSMREGESKRLSSNDRDRRSPSDHNFDRRPSRDIDSDRRSDRSHSSNDRRSHTPPQSSPFSSAIAELDEVESDLSRAPPPTQPIVPFLRGLAAHSHISPLTNSVLPDAQVLDSARAIVSRTVLKHDLDLQRIERQRRKEEEKREQERLDQLEEERIKKQREELARRYKKDVKQEHQNDPQPSEFDRETGRTGPPTVQSQFSPRGNDGVRSQFSPRGNGAHERFSPQVSSSRRLQGQEYDPLNYSHSPERQSSSSRVASSHSSSHRPRKIDQLSESTVQLMEIEADAKKRIEKLERLEEERLRSRSGSAATSYRSQSHASLHSPSRPSSSHHSSRRISSPPSSPGLSHSLAEGSFHVSKAGIPSLPSGSSGMGLNIGSAAGTRSTRHQFEQSLHGSSDFHVVPDGLAATIRRGGGVFPTVSESGELAAAGLDDRLDPPPARILDETSVFILPDGRSSRFPEPFDDAGQGIDVNASSRGFVTQAPGSVPPPPPSLHSPAHRFGSSHLFTTTFALPSQTTAVVAAVQSPARTGSSRVDGSNAASVTLPPPLTASLSPSSSYIANAAAAGNHSTPKRTPKGVASISHIQAPSPAHSYRSESENYLDDSIQFDSPVSKTRAPNAPQSFSSPVASPTRRNVHN